MIFAAHATAIKYIGLLLSPIPRKIELIILYAVINGIPTKHMVRYAAVPSAASAGVDIAATIARTDRSKTTVITTETAINNVTVLPTLRDALLRSPLPTACAMLTVVPIASPTIITVSICMTCEPTDTAVVAATPSNCPIMNKSAIP